MRKSLIAALLLSCALPSADAQTKGYGLQQSPRAEKKSDEATPTTGTTGKRSLIERIFGGKPKPTPAPTPTPAPAPTPKRRARTKATAEGTEKPAPAKPAVAEVATAPARPKPEKTTGKGATKKGAPAGANLSGLDDPAKYQAVRLQAMEDPQVKELKSRADSTIDETESHKASMEYNRALFKKIRQLEPSLDSYVDRVEGAMTKRLGAEKSRP